MVIETFSASGGLYPDSSEAANWSIGSSGKGSVSGAGTRAIAKDGTIAIVDATPSVVVEAGRNIAQSHARAEPRFETAGDILVGGGRLAIDETEFSDIGNVLIGDSGVFCVDGAWTNGGQATPPPAGDIDLGGGGLAGFNEGITDRDFSIAGPGTIALGDPADAPPPAETLAVVPIAGGAEIVARGNHEVPPCLARGTRILTPSGYVPVEQLQPGDLVVTSAGTAETLRWVGRRRVDLAGHRRPDAVWPIRVTAGALGEGIPGRDVQLSPDHPLLLDGLLVPVKCLVNNATILRDRDCPTATYFHLELARHGVIFAENMQVDTCLDTGNRRIFTHESGPARQSPIFGRGAQWNDVARPRLRAIRQKLFDRLAALGFRHRIMPDVSLVIDGRRIERSFGMAWLPCFRLPPHQGKITIRSATFVPAEMAVGPDDDEDWRVLGIGLRRIRADQQIFAPKAIATSGFHPRGAGDMVDWTDGNATISVPPETAVIGLNILALPKAWLAMPPVSP